MIESIGIYHIGIPVDDIKPKGASRLIKVKGKPVSKIVLQERR